VVASASVISAHALVVLVWRAGELVLTGAALSPGVTGAAAAIGD
jgi:TATA-box binding protein (TBP) (component of TFIID and TFIIIB)